MSLPITAIIMTKNEAANLPRCLDHCRVFSQVVVVDSGSTDDTPVIARAAGAELVSFVWNGQYPKKKQWCLDNVDIREPWVLFLDADEYPTPGLCQELATICQADLTPGAPVGYYLRAKVGHLGQLMRFGRKHCKIALMRTGAGHFPVIDDLDVPGGWEVEGHYQPMMNGPVGRLNALLVHDDLKPQQAWRDRHHNYASWSAHMRQRQALNAAEQAEPWLRRRLKTLMNHLPGRPLLAFFDSYILCLGFLDGAVGYDYARARASYYAAIDRAYRDVISASSSDGLPAGATGSTRPVPSADIVD